MEGFQVVSVPEGLTQGLLREPLRASRSKWLVRVKGPLGSNAMVRGTGMATWADAGGRYVRTKLPCLGSALMR